MHFAIHTAALHYDMVLGDVYHAAVVFAHTL